MNQNKTVSNKNKSRAEYQRLRRQKLKGRDNNTSVVNVTKIPFTLSKTREEAIKNIPEDNEDNETQQQQQQQEEEDNTEEPDMNDAYLQYQEDYNDTINQGVKSLQAPDYVNDLNEYFETSNLLDELKDTQLQLKNTQDLLIKTNELVSILNSELIDKHKVIKDLHKKNNGISSISTLDDLNKYFHINKYKMLDDNEELDEVEMSKDHFELLKQKLEDFEYAFIEQMKEKHNLK